MNANEQAFQKAMASCGMIAILRGIRPEEAVSIGRVLYAAGFRLIEVPLNSPEPFASIAGLREALPEDCLIGAGTVLRPEDCRVLAGHGGQIVVMPHSDPEVIRAAKAAGLVCTPGVATLTEAFAAIHNGADALKMFPAEQLGVPALKAWRAVLRKPYPILPVGGVDPSGIGAYLEAGASGFGLGSALYRPGDDVQTVEQHARAFVKAWRDAQPESLTSCAL